MLTSNDLTSLNNNLDQNPNVTYNIIHKVIQNAKK